MPGWGSRSEIWPDQKKNAAESDDQTEHQPRGQRIAIFGERLDADHPEGRHRHGNGGDAARNPLFGPDDAAIADTDREQADDGESPPLRQLDHRLTARSQKPAQKQAGSRVAKAADERRRNRFERDANAEVRRAPENADRNPRDIRVPPMTFVGGEVHPYRLTDNVEHVVAVTSRVWVRPARGWARRRRCSSCRFAWLDTERHRRVR